MTGTCLCGHSYRDHFEGGACPCGCLIFEPGGKPKDMPVRQEEMRLPDPVCDICLSEPCECDERRDLR
jgi:hypothetical protein